MKIIIEKSGSVYRANLQDLPGSPNVGVAPTPEEAVVDLFWSLLHPTNRRENWMQYVDFSTLSIERKENSMKYVCGECGSVWEDENPYCPNLECPITKKQEPLDG